MYELINVAPSTYYIQSPAKIGLVKLNDTEVCLIDSGNDKDAGKKILKILQQNGWTLSAIYNTHSNADHIGGNRFLQERTGCKIYAKGIEADMTRHPILEPAFLYGGFPPAELRHKFLLAQPSEALDLSGDCLTEGFSVIELGGHFFDMVGFRTPDDVVFLADCLSSEDTLSKYQLTFIYDVAEYLNTLENIKNMKAKLFVPSHAQPTQDIVPLAQYNINKVYEIGDMITNLCCQPYTFEQLLKKVFDEYALVMTFEQYALVGSTLRSYLTWLKEQGRIKAYFSENMLLWEKA